MTKSIYNVELGSNTAFTTGIFDTLHLYLEVGIRTIPNDPNSVELMEPRLPLTNTPFAKHAAYADEANETDPTVPASVKDGTSWAEVSSKPAGFADNIDDVGLASETDPQVGSNTTDYVPKWDGSTLVSGTLFDNGNVGIGTNSPESLFHLESIGGIDLIIEVDSNNMWQDQNARIVLRQGVGSVSSRLNYRHAENDLEIMQEFNHSLIFGTNDIDRLTIKNNGVVRILSDNQSGALFELSNSYNLPFPVSKTLGSVNFRDYAGTTRGSISYFHHGLLDDGDSTGLYFSTEGQERMIVDWDGKVGIGTMNPATELQITGGSDAQLIDGSGFVVIGEESETNIVMDSNEIMARNSGASSKLYLNAEGGNVVVKVLEITATCSCP